MKKPFFIIAALFLSLTLCAQEISFETEKMYLSVDESGKVSHLKVCNKEILLSKTYPLIVAFHENRLVEPTSFISLDDGIYKVDFEDGGYALLDINSYEKYVKITIRHQEVANEEYDALLLCPLGLSIYEVVGDIIGVVQGKGVAFGIQALNIKTNAGIPQEYVDLVHARYEYEGESASVSTSTIPSYRLAATKIEKGAMMQFSARYRGSNMTRKVEGVEGSMVLPVEGPDASIDGASVALFGCIQKDALSTIGEIELAEDLPHPMFDGEWGKTSRAAMKSYLISDFSASDLDNMLSVCHKAGWEYLYHIEPFDDWGHFHWSPDFVKGGDDAVRRLVERCEKEGVHMGIHTLSNFITTNDAYVVPKLNEHILKQGPVELFNDVTADQVDFALRRTSLFDRPSTLNLLLIDKELVSFGTMEPAGDLILLHRCTRGVLGTQKSAHSRNAQAYKLWDHAYKTLFPDLVLQDSMALRLVEVFNNTGLSQISFDGLEGCMYTGQDDYATARFVKTCYDGWDHNVLNDGSNLNHFTWHINTRMNWGEPWGEAMRVGQVDARIKNQDFFRRNLFPRMMGWFKISLADRKFECTNLEDVEWAMSEAAGFDAGYGMTIYQKALKGHGQLDEILEAIKNWDELRMSDAFDESLKEELRDPYTEWHLEAVDDHRFNLYQLHISRRYRCDLSEMQPGQPGGADWQWDTPYPGRFALRLYVDGEGSISRPTFRTPDGIIEFDCTLKAGQYLLYGFDGKAIITDKNYNYIDSVDKQGVSMLPEGKSSVSFSCDVEKGDEQPEVVVRVITRDIPMAIEY